MSESEKSEGKGQATGVAGQVTENVINGDPLTQGTLEAAGSSLPGAGLVLQVWRILISMYFQVLMVVVNTCRLPGLVWVI